MGTLVCTVVMSKEDGLTVTIDNKDASITQTIKMNGTTIELKVAGSDATSVVTQSQTKVSIACDEFEVTAQKTVTISSSQASTYKSGDTLAIQSAADMTLKSDTRIAGTGQTEIALTGGSTGKLALAAAAAKLSGTEVALDGTAQLSGKAPQVALKSDAMMSLESTGLCTLKGSLTNVQGSLVNLG